MKASFDVTLSQKDLYRFNMYQTYTGFQGWTSIVLGILGFVMAGISFQNGKISYTLLYTAVGFLFLLYIPVALWFRAKEILKTNKVLASTLHYEISDKNIHVSQGKETGDMEWEAVYKIVANAKQILIYSNRKSAYIIPMEQIGDQYVAFREIAEQKLEKYKLRMKA
jgi:predicted permease